MFLPKLFTDAALTLGTLPGIGPKAAERLVFYILDQPEEEVRKLAEVLVKAKDAIRFCRRCGNFAEADLCEVCQDTSRDAGTVCVVEEIRDLAAIEKTGAFHGLYHVLHGHIDPIGRIGPAELQLDHLVERMVQGNVREVIIATNPNFNGDITAMYLAKLLGTPGIRTTRIATGIPKGSDLEFADVFTLTQALEKRTDVSG
ncbi:MAG: recombination mediator RecR [Caldisericota bacterium]|jgi:recombination protein RecR|nr:recombination mediator RecR [Caldisericota bacterium]